MMLIFCEKVTKKEKSCISHVKNVILKINSCWQKMQHHEGRNPQNEMKLNAQTTCISTNK